MKNTRVLSALLLSVAAVLGLSACNSSNDGEYTVGQAYKYILKNKPNALRRMLTGQAKEQFGSAEGLKQIQDTLAPFASVSIGESTLTGREIRGLFQYTYYSVEVVGQKDAAVDAVERIYSVEVSCRVKRGVDHNGLNMKWCGISNVR